MKNKNKISQIKIDSIVRHRASLYTALLSMAEFERAYNTINKTHRGAIVCNILRVINGTESNEYRTIEVSDMVENLLDKREYTFEKFNEERNKKHTKITDPYSLYKSYKIQSEELTEIFTRQLEFLAGVISDSYYYHYYDKSEDMKQLISIFNEYGIGIEDNSINLDRDSLNESAIDVLRHLRDNIEYDKVERGVIHLAIITDTLKIKDILAIIKYMRRALDSITNEYSYMGMIEKAYNKLREATKDITNLVRKHSLTYIPQNADCRRTAEILMNDLKFIGIRLENVLHDAQQRMPKNRTNINPNHTMPDTSIEDLVNMVRDGITMYSESMMKSYSISEFFYMISSTIIFSAIMIDLLQDDDIIAGMDIFTIPFTELIKSEMRKIEFGIRLSILSSQFEKTLD